MGKESGSTFWACKTRPPYEATQLPKSCTSIRVHTSRGYTAPNSVLLPSNRAIARGTGSHQTLLLHRSVKARHELPARRPSDVEQRTPVLKPEPPLQRTAHLAEAFNSRLLPIGWRRRLGKPFRLFVLTAGQNFTNCVDGCRRRASSPNRFQQGPRRTMAELRGSIGL